MNNNVIVSLAIILTTTGACVTHNKKDHSVVFQKSTFSNKTEIDSFYQKVFTKAFTSLEEARLDTGQETEFRLTVLPSNSNKFVIRIRINEKDSLIELTYKRLAFNGSPVKGIDIRLSKHIGTFENPVAYMELTELLKEAQFWDLNNNYECEGPDGDLYLLEGLSNGRYHTAFRWSPEVCKYPGSKEFMNLVNYITALKSVH